MSLEIKVPAPGESISEVTIANWLKKEGEWVDMDEPIAEFESDKATFVVNAEKAGLIDKLIGNIGDVIKVGSVVALINTEGVNPETVKIPKQEKTAEADPVKKANAEIAQPTVITEILSNGKSALAQQIIHTNASPIALQLLNEYKLDPSNVEGSGSNGKITKLDVLEAIVKLGAAIPVNYGLGNRNDRREKMSNLRKTVSKRLVAVKNETAMLTTFNEVNMKAIMDLRNQYKKSFEEKFGVGLGFMSFFTRAICLALKEWPAVNASIEGDEIVFHDYCDISIAVSAPKGLVVPVVRNAENLSLDQIETEIKRLATRARESKLSIEEMTGGTFTITNGGVFGSMMSTPIINAPQSAILGMHNIVERPIAENGQVVIRPMMYLALSYDHRIIDGRESVSFLVKVKTLLENPGMLMDGKNSVEKVLGL